MQSKSVNSYFLYVLLLVAITSCNPTSFYQILTLQPSEGSKLTDENILFEDENCIIQYNFWQSRGSTSFSIRNKSDEYLTMDLAQSFYVENGIAQPYFQDRTFTNTIGNIHCVLWALWKGCSGIKHFQHQYSLLQGATDYCYPAKDFQGNRWIHNTE
jgi:hypothetical protein